MIKEKYKQYSIGCFVVINALFRNIERPETDDDHMNVRFPSSFAHPDKSTMCEVNLDIPALE